MSSEQYLKKVKRFYRNNRRLPTYTELCDLLGFASRNAAYRLMHKWEQAGIIEKIGNRFSPTNNFFSLPLLATIQAGTPSLLDEHPAEMIQLHDYLLGNSDGSVCLLRVSGESMIEAGINPGDLAVIDTERDPHNGEIVAAMVDGAWTLKSFERKGRNISLIPANKNFEPITANEELIVGGVMISLIRKYRN